MRKYFLSFLILVLVFAGAVTALGQTEPESEPEPILAGGGVFMMGTTLEEIEAAVELCEPEVECDVAEAADSLPAHEVMVDPYQIGQLEVSNAEYADFLNTLGPDSHLEGCLGKQCVLVQDENVESNLTFDGTTYAPASDAGMLPVTHVSWYGAQAYCEAQGGRLPTEAEWELAVRGGSGAIYPWGAEFDPSRANTAATGVEGLMPVDAYPGGLSHYGALNMIGNAAEWVQDWYGADFYSSAAAGDNPTGPEEGDERVIRGGSWQDEPFYARAPQRASAPPDAMLPTVGFRCAKDGWPTPDAPQVDTVSRYEDLEAGTLEDGAPYVGSLDAPVVLTEFFQFTCPHCNNFRETLHQLWPYVEADQLRIVSRPLVNNNPLTLGPSLVALCVEQQQPGGYWPFHEYIFNGVFDEGNFALVWHRVQQRAELFGLEEETLTACLGDDDALISTLQANLELANQMQVTGVPAVLINGDYIERDGQPIRGGVPLADLERAIEAALND